ncbi:hypothetical protein J2S09_003625 [Bacillus fengqiuensis]|nr:hypothetical protein [Bacillus fengqiuensis]
MSNDLRISVQEEPTRALPERLYEDLCEFIHMEEQKGENRIRINSSGK